MDTVIGNVARREPSDAKNGSVEWKSGNVRTLFPANVGVGGAIRRLILSTIVVGEGGSRALLPLSSDAFPDVLSTFISGTLSSLSFCRKETKTLYLAVLCGMLRGSYRGIFVMRDQIISFTVKRDFKKIFFVIRDAHISRDT